MFVHMYNTQDNQCPYIISNAAMCWSGSRSVSLFHTLHITLCMYVNALQIIYIYIKSIQDF